MDHLTRIQKAIDFVEDNLREELATEQIAKVAAFSMWHFQTVFSSIVGDSVKGYVRGRRLTAAMTDLGSTGRRIIDIAMDYQFESQESFSRAFKSMFGRTPGECRKQGITSISSLKKPRITMEYLDHLYGGMTMQPIFKTFEAMQVIGMSTHFICILSPEKNNHIVIPKLWDSFIERASEIAGRLGPADIGLCEAVANPAEKRHPDEFFYMAGVQVSQIDKVPPGMMVKTVPAGRYAVFTHKGTLDKLEHTMNYIFGSWLAKSGEELRDAPDLELYGERFKYGSEDSELEICIPVKSLDPGARG